ncbi:MAG: hypothetical protein J07HB67_00696 [halophilic archaeon J07HB67]|nr:MAG: hypothetical protein J07HB67_00696 [halophilic archaeon J07HB67]
MVSVERVSFQTDGHEADERLVREYVLPAMDRLESVDGCRGVRFSRFGRDPRYDRSEIVLGIYGDYEAVIERERSRWDELVADGLAGSWSREGPPFPDQPESVRAVQRQAYLFGSHAARTVYDLFDDPPALVDEVTDDAGRRYGMWTALHVLTNNLGYGPEGEVDAYELLLRDRLVALTEIRDHEFVRSRIDDLRSELDDLETTVDELESAGGFDYYDGPE